MEETEISTEALHQQIEHEAHASRERWLSRVALTSALLAVLAATAALLSGKYANEAMIEQMKATDQWSFYQAKSIKAAILEANAAHLTFPQRSKIETYRVEQEKIMESAKELEHSSALHLEKHEIFARGVTLFQVAIGIAAIAALTRKRPFWYGSIAFGICGATFLLQGFFHS